MKTFRWIKNALLIVAVAVLVIAADIYLDEPLVLRYGEWQAAPSAAVAAAAAAAAAVLMVLAFKLISFILFLPARLVGWKQERDKQGRQELLANGLRALSLGDNKQALKCFMRLADDDDLDGVYAWLAAEAAQKLGDRRKREELLRRAAATNSDIIAAAAKARLAAEDNRLSEAFNILSAAGAPGKSPLLAKMFLETSRQCDKWPQALAAAYYMRDQSPSHKWRQAVSDMARMGLKKAADADALKLFWKNEVRNEEQKNPQLLAEYVYALHRLGDEKAMLGALEQAVKIAGDSPEVLSAIAALGTKHMCETAVAAAQKRTDNTDNAASLPALAMLTERLGLWGKARRYYQMANALHPDPRHTKALAELEEKMKSGSDGEHTPHNR